MPGTTLQYAPQVVEVEVDPETGDVKVIKVTAMQDVGFAMNPMSVEGQIEGDDVWEHGILYRRCELGDWQAKLL